LTGGRVVDDDAQAMIKVRRSEDRGLADFGWLKSRHTFSFGNYGDPAFMGHGPLRVINEDRVQPGAGFPTHSHRDMEIISWVLDGALEHKDSLGTSSVIRPGDLQRMTAGNGVRHSEYNASKVEPVHFLQIWVMPGKDGLAPGYDQRAFPDLDGKLRLVASGQGRDGSVLMHQDADLYIARLAKGNQVRHDFRPERLGWLQVARGEVRVGGEVLKQGDGAALESAGSLSIEAQAPAEILLFDMVP
jgi:redox-sensitive bicupin YhaK (pirin superfamily)